MATLGVEGVRYFPHARAAGIDAADLTYTFNRTNGFDSTLRSAGHTRSFYWANTDVWEDDIRDSDQGGDDRHWVDNVDIFWIDTHGNNTNGRARLFYDTAAKNWVADSAAWQLGEDWNAEWVMAYACHTVSLNNVGALWNIFAGLHMYCGAWNNMYDGITTDECGEDVADNLVHGHPVSESWIDGVSDWAVDNHPICICVGDAATWNNGNINWSLSALNRDHLWGHGDVSPDLPPAQQACLLWRWAEG